jgi:hypothetical protein
MKQLCCIIFLFTLLIACNSVDKPASTAPVVEALKPLGISKNADSFTISFEKMLQAYLLAKEALVNYDTTTTNVIALQLSLLADSLAINAIKGDATGTIVATAKNYAGTIGGSAKAMAGEQDITKKKKEFQMISEALYDLVRTVKYDGQKLYHQHCPMAFNDNEEAYWISTSNEIVNPYLGKKHPKYKNAMLHCGDITDSLDFRK